MHDVIVINANYMAANDALKQHLGSKQRWEDGVDIPGMNS